MYTILHRLLITLTVFCWATTSHAQSIIWQSGYPKVFTGATTVDVVVKTDQNATVYAAAFRSEQLNITSQDIKNEAIGSSSTAEASEQSDVTSGVEFKIELTELRSDRDYHLYITYENPSGELLANDFIIYDTFYAPDRQVGFEDFKISRRVQGYLLYIPEEHLKYKTPTPLSLFFHGLGEQSNDHDDPNLGLLSNRALPRYIKNGNDIPIAIASPQTSVSWSQSDPTDVLDSLYNFIMHKVNTNPSQRFITGLSDGGGAVFNYMRFHADNLAASAPMAAYPKPKKYEEDGTISEVAKIPTWGFMGSNDGFGGLRGLIGRINDLGGEAFFTLYNGVGHNSWDRTYNLSGMNASNVSTEHDPYNISVYNWLVSHTNPTAPPYQETVAPATPDTPISAFSGETFTYLNWEESIETDLYYYEIHKRTGSGDFILVDTTINNAYLDNELAAGVNYRYKIKSVDYRINKSPFSGEFVIATSTDDTPPAQVTGLSAVEQGEDFIRLDWATSSEPDFNNYKVYRSTDGGGFSVVSSPTNSSYIDQGLESLQNYSYYVTAVDASGNESVVSNTIDTSTISDIIAPNTPSGLMAGTITRTSIELEWNSNSETDFSHYQVYRIEEGGNELLIRNFLFSNNFDDTGLSPETNYSYRITAVDNSDNISGFSNSIEAQTLEEIDVTPPSAPTGAAIAALLQTSVSIEWDDNTEQDFSHYDFYRVVNGGSQELIGDALSISSFVDNNVTEADVIIYSIVAVDDSNNESSATTLDEIAIPESIQQPIAPTNLVLEENITSVSLSWNISVSDNISHYNLHRSYENGPFELIQGNLTETAFEDINLSSGFYIYVVSAVSSENVPSEFSNDVNILFNAPPTHVTGLTSSTSSSSITIEWAENEEDDIMGYKVYRRQNEEFQLISETLTDNTFNDTDIDIETIYEYAVTAVNESGKESTIEETVFEKLEQNITVTHITEEEVPLLNDIQVIPNPSDGSSVKIQINDYDGGSYRLSIIDIHGHTVFRTTFNNSSFLIDQPLASGIYLVRVSSDHKLFKTKRLMVK